MCTLVRTSACPTEFAKFDKNKVSFFFSSEEKFQEILYTQM